MMMNFAKDINRKGELDKFDSMAELGKKIIKGKDMGLAFITEGYYGYDALAVIPNSPKFSEWEGYVVYNEELNKAQFIKE